MAQSGFRQAHQLIAVYTRLLLQALGYANRTCVLSPSCREYTGAQIKVENRGSTSAWRHTTTKTPNRVRLVSRKLLISQRVHRFTVETTGVGVDNLSVSFVSGESFQLCEVGQGGAFQKRRAILVDSIQPAEQFLR